MLTSDQLDALTPAIVDLYAEYEQSILNDIARRLGNMDFASAAWQMQRLNESGAVYKNALKQLALLTGKSEKELAKIFKDAGVKAMRFDDAIYKAAGLNPLPLNLSPAMAQVLAAGLRKTKGILSNLTMTTAMSGQQAFIKAADLAYMQVSTGAMSYDQAIRAAVKKMADEGLSVVNYASGHVDKIDVAIRRTVLTGVSQTTGEMQMQLAAQMGSDLVAVSAHIGARPEHQEWQGKIYSISGTSKEHPDFVAETGYGTGAGLMGWNCRHSFYPYFEGISENAYKQSELDSYANKTVTYNGREMSVYEATQYQRGIERKIRDYKRQADALGSAGQPNTSELAKVKEWQGRMREFVKETGLDRQRVRESVIVVKPVDAPVVVKPLPQALGADASMEARLKTQRYNELVSIPANKQKGLLQKIFTPNEIPKMKYHSKWFKSVEVDSAQDYQKKFEEFLASRKYRIFTGIKDRERLWYFIDLEDRYFSAYNESRSEHYTFSRKENIEQHFGFLKDNIHWLVEIKQVEDFFEVLDSWKP